MTPKEKAKELYDYYIVLFSDADYDLAKQKAKIAARKVVNEILHIQLCGGCKDCCIDIKYWEQVYMEL